MKSERIRKKDVLGSLSQYEDLSLNIRDRYDETGHYCEGAVGIVTSKRTGLSVYIDMTSVPLMYCCSSADGKKRGRFRFESTVAETYQSMFALLNDAEQADFELNKFKKG